MFGFILLVMRKTLILAMIITLGSIFTYLSSVGGSKHLILALCHLIIMEIQWTYLGTDVIVRSSTGSISFSYEEYVYGCTDPVALNYDANATADDGSCEYILGCTDPNYSNYDPDATQDDGSCVCDGTELAMTMYDSYGDSWNGNTYMITDAGDTSVVLGEGTMPDLAGGGPEYPYTENVCIQDDGDYAIYVENHLQKLVLMQRSFLGISSVENGAVVLSGGAPYPNGLIMYLQYLCQISHLLYIEMGLF